MPRGRAKAETPTETPAETKPTGKQPAKPYLLFAAEHREAGMERLKARKTNLGYPIKKVKPGDLQKMIGQMWHELSDAQKKPYEDKYAKAFAKFLEQQEDAE